MSSDLDAFIRELRRKGWTQRLRSGGHWQFTHPSGAWIIMSATPSDRRAIPNARAQARRIERSG